MPDTTKYLSGGRIQGTSTSGTGAVDTLGTAVNGSNSGCVAENSTPIHGQNSTTFDNNDAAHNFGNNTVFSGLVKEDFTVTFWAKCTGKGNMGWGQGSNPGNSPYAGNQGCVLCLGAISAAGQGFVISFDDNNTNQFFVCAGDGNNVFLNDTQNDGADHDGNWHLYMFHFDNTNEELRVYRDGNSTARDTTPYEQAVTSTTSTTFGNMMMGRQTGDDVRYYIGQLADVSIWKRLVTTTEFNFLWNTFEDDTNDATSSVTGANVSAMTNQEGLLANWKLNDLNFTNSATKVDKDKTTLLNIPLGTRYEETDTKKIFTYKQSLIDGTGLKAYYKFNDASGNPANTANEVAGNSTLGSSADLVISGTGTIDYQTTGLPSELSTGMEWPSTNASSGRYGKFGTSLSDWNFLHGSPSGGVLKWHLCFWAKYPTTAYNNQSIFRTGTGDTTAGMVIYHYGPSSGDGAVRCFISRQGGGNQQAIQGYSAAGFFLFDDNWHFYSFQMDFSESSNKLIIRRDMGTSSPAKQTFNQNGSYAPDAESQNSANPFSWRSDADQFGTYIPPTAEYAEISIWRQRILSETELSSLYNFGDGMQLDTGLKLWKERGTA